jgi:Lrp/AsnC family leucine-responsive transcriptional regulator
MDDIDIKILNILQKDARTANADIARKVRMAPSAVHERIRKLEETGTIESYETRVNVKKANLGLAAFIFVRSNDPVGEERTADELAKIPEVLEVHHVAGEDCYLAKVRVADTGHLAELMRKQLGKISSITGTRTTIVLETLKETTSLPLMSRQGKA